MPKHSKINTTFISPETEMYFPINVPGHKTEAAKPNANPGAFGRQR